MDLLENLLENELFAESAVYIPAGGTAVNVTVRIRRDAGGDRFLVKDQFGNQRVYRAWVQLLPYVHATYGGVVAPKEGDVLQAELMRGSGTKVNWKIGQPTALDGRWELPLTYTDRAEAAGHRQEKTG